MLFESLIELKKKFQYGAETVDLLLYSQKLLLTRKKHNNLFTLKRKAGKGSRVCIQFA